MSTATVLALVITLARQGRLRSGARKLDHDITSGCAQVHHDVLATNSAG
jgi:hypothetical protein